MHDYLPQYYDDIPVAANIIDREAAEFARISADAYDVLAQMFVDTSTWGLARWERQFGIVTDEAKPIDQRRAVIKSRISGAGTVTPTLIKSVAEAYANGDVEVTEFGTNMLPPFSAWTLHENTRMARANFVGKVAGSTVANPHNASFTSQTSLQLPSGTWTEVGQVSGYNASAILDGTTMTTSTTTSISMSQQRFSFNLIEHVTRTYGAGVFGSATTTAERVTWLKANVAKITGNWYGFGSGPSGSVAYLRLWNGSSWAGTGSTTSATVALMQSLLVVGNIADKIMSDGFIHYLAYSDASNGTIASTIRTDYVELEVYMAAGSVPQADYSLILSANTTSQTSYIDIACLPSTTYTLSVVHNAKIKLQTFDAVGTVLSNPAYSTSASVSLTTEATAKTLRINLSNESLGAGTYTFKNPQLERGSVATPFEALSDYTIGIKFVSSLGIPPNIADLEAAIRDALPAHLAITYVFSYITFGEIEGYGVTYGAIETAGLTYGKLETWEGP